MKRSELKLTGETYNLTPDCWGVESIIIDGPAAITLKAECFDVNEDDVDTDYSGEVEIATDDEGNFYAILVPFEGRNCGHKTGKIYNQNMYRGCQNPTGANCGTIEIYGQTWETFDDEDDE